MKQAINAIAQETARLEDHSACVCSPAAHVAALVDEQQQLQAWCALCLSQRVNRIAWQDAWFDRCMRFDTDIARVGCSVAAQDKELFRQEQRNCIL